jgi:AbrB family looped-hinge helix DNA binding protein
MVIFLEEEFEMYKAKISKKGQITIPKELREKFSLKENSELILVPTKDGILVRAKSQGLQTLRGFFQELNFEEIEQSIQDERRKWRFE